MLPTCGWFYDYGAMLRAEVHNVRGETAGKKPPLVPRSRPWVRRWRRSTRSSLAASMILWVRILMSHVSGKRNSFLSSHIIVGNSEVRWVSTPITVWLFS